MNCTKLNSINNPHNSQTQFSRETMGGAANSIDADNGTTRRPSLYYCIIEAPNMLLLHNRGRNARPQGESSNIGFAAEGLIDHPCRSKAFPSIPGFLLRDLLDRAGQASLYLCGLNKTKSAMFQHISTRRLVKTD